jgi:hypothetical protein
MEVFRRLFFNYSTIKLSTDESTNFPVTTNLQTKQYLCKRKTIIRCALLFILINIIAGIISIIREYQDIDTNNLIVTENSIKKLLAIDISLVISDVIKFALLFLSQCFWYNYKQSVKFNLACGILVIYAQLILLFIPYNNIIQPNSTDNRNNLIFNTGIVIDILYNIYSYVLPNAIIIQAVLNQSVVLNGIYKSNEFRVINMVLTSIYICMFTFAMSIPFQLFLITSFILPCGISASVYTVIFCILYIISMILPLISYQHTAKTIASWFLSIILLAMLFYIVYVIQINIIVMLLRVCIGYLTMSTILSDFLLHVVLTNHARDITFIDTFLQDTNYISSDIPYHSLELSDVRNF